MTADSNHVTVKKNIGKAEALLHSLVPRAQCFCFYDNDHECAWSSDGAEDFEIDGVLGDLPDEVIAKIGEGDGILRRTLASGRTVLSLPVHGQGDERLGLLVALFYCNAGKA